MSWQVDDAVAVVPELHEVIFENDKVRMLKVTVPAGATAAMHWHPNSVNYVLSGGVLQFSFLNETIREVELASGATIPGIEGRHQVENTGETEVQTIQVEFK